MAKTKDHPAQDESTRTEQLLLVVSIQGPCTQQEVARHLGISPKTVSSHEHNALRKLREAIKRDGELRDFFLSHLAQPRPRQNLYQIIRTAEREWGDH